MALLGGKTQRHYEVLLEALKDGVLAITGRRLEPRQCITDFEAALMIAIRAAFPQTRSYGCYFHFCSSLYRKIQDLGLQVAYRRNEDLKDCVRRIMAIGYLPLAHVRGSFDNLRNDPATVRLVADFPHFNEFLDYFQITYLNGNLFPPCLWNVHQRPMAQRTNNAVESFHRRWNAQIGRAHPSLWAVIRRMKKEGKRTESSLAKALRGDRPPRIKRKWRRLERRIDILNASLRDGGHTLAEYWAAVVYVTHEFH
ncbi:uncharacterized protein LOC121426511 [Lytechinus variegatus]|uniref:uncharacterized protein LOC121426511 n=1 Tax=Lytechinus variegatus TaxID=7654 RepID=UPI001BB24225|nr:uncharacterized protein LOC121426511 [Lytechinus variegatus]